MGCRVTGSHGHVQCSLREGDGLLSSQVTTSKLSVNQMTTLQRASCHSCAAWPETKPAQVVCKYRADVIRPINSSLAVSSQHVQSFCTGGEDNLINLHDK